MQSEIDETDSLKIYIARFSAENDKIKVKNDKIRAKNTELKARIAKLEDIQIQNELIKNLLSHIIVRLPKNLVKRACERLLHHSKDPVPLESIFEKSERIESYLRHTLKVYNNSLNRKKRKNIAQKKVLRPQSWPEYNVFPVLPAIYVIDNGTQTINITCDHEEENNHWVINELKVFCQHLLDYNKRTFEKFM
ncbi:hypothetical protein C1646_760704 [Rhizophagus diaphanus]|nr:hypothetical protein C1646_760704 [Rhizophagus diaphanus] [Rhizophagus sp. MUCL 43196]